MALQSLTLTYILTNVKCAISYRADSIWTSTEAWHMSQHQTYYPAHLFRLRLIRMGLLSIPSRQQADYTIYKWVSLILQLQEFYKTLQIIVLNDIFAFREIRK